MRQLILRWFESNLTHQKENYADMNCVVFLLHDCQLILQGIQFLKESLYPVMVHVAVFQMCRFRQYYLEGFSPGGVA